MYGDLDEANLPLAVDWRETKAVSEVKNQLQVCDCRLHRQVSPLGSVFAAFLDQQRRAWVPGGWWSHRLWCLWSQVVPARHHATACLCVVKHRLVLLHSAVPAGRSPPLVPWRASTPLSPMTWCRSASRSWWIVTPPRTRAALAASWTLPLTSSTGTRASTLRRTTHTQVHMQASYKCSAQTHVSACY